MSKYIKLEDAIEYACKAHVSGCVADRIKAQLQSLPTIEVSEDAISREWVLNEFKKDYDDIYDLMQAIENAPSVVPSRPKGEWRTTDAYPHRVFCSECYKTFAQSHWEVWEDGSLPRSFCPNCGADMRGNKE